MTEAAGRRSSSSDQPLVGMPSGQRLAELALIREPDASSSAWARLCWWLRIGFDG